MAKEMGGGRSAQIIAALAAVPFCLGAGALMQYISFDYFAWVLTAFFIVKLLQSGEPRHFLLIGASIGLGMMAKYTMLFFSFGVLAGFLRRMRENICAPFGRGSDCFCRWRSLRRIFSGNSTTTSSPTIS